jgi:hypothetical protein
MKFINQIGLEQSVIELAASFAQQPLYIPPNAEPVERQRKVNLLLASDEHLVSHLLQSTEPGRGGASRGQEEDGRKPVAEDGGIRVNSSGAGDDHAGIELSQPTAQAQLAKPLAARTHLNLVGIDRACTGHHRIRCGAEFVEMFQVTPASKTGHGAIVGGDLAVCRHRHVHQDEWARNPFHWINMASP